jgi:two-component system alkaline phosphatase synthesis response regulator PhoP
VKLEGERAGEVFALSQKECMLMKLLIEKEGQVVSRDEILDRVWGYDVYPSTRTVDNFILRLRKIFEKEPSDPRHLHSVRGMGYKFTATPSLPGRSNK